MPQTAWLTDWMTVHQQPDPPENGQSSTPKLVLISHQHKHIVCVNPAVRPGKRVQAHGPDIPATVSSCRSQCYDISMQSLFWLLLPQQLR